MRLWLNASFADPAPKNTTSTAVPSLASQEIKSGPVRPRLAERSYRLAETRFSTPCTYAAIGNDAGCGRYGEDSFFVLGLNWHRFDATDLPFCGSTADVLQFV